MTPLVYHTLSLLPCIVNAESFSMQSPTQVGHSNLELEQMSNETLSEKVRYINKIITS